MLKILAACRSGREPLSGRDITNVHTLLTGTARIHCTIGPYVQNRVHVLVWSTMTISLKYNKDSLSSWTAVVIYDRHCIQGATLYSHVHQYCTLYGITDRLKACLWSLSSSVCPQRDRYSPHHQPVCCLFSSSPLDVVDSAIACSARRSCTVWAPAVK